MATSTKKISVFPRRSEAPAKTLRSNPSASILTISGRSNCRGDDFIEGLDAEQKCWEQPSSTGRGSEGTAIVAKEMLKGGCLSDRRRQR